MPYLTFILGVYFLLLSLVPCADGKGRQLPNQLGPQATTIAHSSDAAHGDEGNSEHHHEKDHDHKEDDCSPFCACHCCHSHFSFYTSTGEITVSSFTTLTASLDKSRLASIEPAPLFKPPKI